MFAKNHKKDINEIYDILLKIKRVYENKKIKANIYTEEREMGVEWQRGESSFSVTINIYNNRGYIQEYTASKQVFIEYFDDINSLIKRCNFLIKKRLV